MKIENLQQFYALMFETRKTRRKIVSAWFKHKNIDNKWINILLRGLQSLQNITKSHSKQVLVYNKDKTILLDLTYEITELKKDIFFLTHSEEKFYSYLEDLYPDFTKKVKEGEKFLGDINFKNFITDRDGTINNYCGRYKSAIQSIYNSIFLTRFAKSAAGNSIILTSAPLENIGLLDISINPENVFIYAGSKGREYLDTNNIRKRLPIEKALQKKLNELNKNLKELVKKPEYELFTLIGSGLQFKFGQSTICRQDIFHSIPAVQSENLLNIIKRLVKKIDPEGDFFRIEDTGLDIEIILTVQGDDNSKKTLIKEMGLVS